MTSEKMNREQAEMHRLSLSQLSNVQLELNFSFAPTARWLVGPGSFIYMTSRYELHHTIL